MYNRVNYFLCRFNLISPKVFGFGTNHSTKHVLINLIEKIKHDLDNGIHIIGIFVDLEKAFGKVDHEIRLKNYRSMELRD